jgi:hypothetical protein
MKFLFARKEDFSPMPFTPQGEEHEEAKDVTVEEIHQEFLSAADRILEQAGAVLSDTENKRHKKAERLAKFGFWKAEGVENYLEVASNIHEAKQKAELIGYFRQHYPLHKFIDEKEVKRICQKYNLLQTGVASYTGFVPEKNLLEMEAFVLREEDYKYFCDYGYDMRFASEISYEEYQTRDKHPNYRYAVEQSHFEICAPEKDLYTEGAIKKGHRLVYPDPVVLQPVRGGYLIVTAWGEEASDESVVNEKFN